MAQRKDEGHEKTDKIIEQTEKKLAKQYKQAEKELNKKLKEFTKKFKAEDEDMRQKLADGEITKDYYQKWRMTRMLTSEHWKDMRDTMAEDLANVNGIARSTINGHTADVYALNRNYAVYQVENDAKIDTSFTLYNRRGVENLINNKENLLPAPKKGSDAWIAMHDKDLRWNQQKINSSLIQGILQGDSIPQIADRLLNVVGMNETSAMRSARTMMTGVQNKARDDAYQELKEKGVELETQWVSTLDDRTRHSHRQLHGEVRDEKTGKYSNGLRYPGDPSGEPGEVYNCRCTEISHVKDIPVDMPKWSPKMTMDFDEWLGEHEEKNVAEKATPAYDFRGIFKNIQGISGDFADGMAEAMGNCKRQEAKDLYAKFADKLKAVSTRKKSGAFFSPLDGGIFFNMKNDALGSSYQEPYEVAFHEFSHMIDNLLSGTRFGFASEKYENSDGLRLIDVIRNDFNKFKLDTGCKSGNDVISLLKSENMDKRTCGNISDILEYCTGKSYPLGIGHGAKYHIEPGMTEAEFVAEAVSSSIVNEASYNQMCRLFPNAVEHVWEMVRSGL